ncbi:MAG: PAS domain S-box protein [Siculibacillus sp.]
MTDRAGVERWTGSGGSTALLAALLFGHLLLDALAQHLARLPGDLVALSAAVAFSAGLMWRLPRGRVRALALCLVGASTLALDVASAVPPVAALVRAVVHTAEIHVAVLCLDALWRTDHRRTLQDVVRVLAALALIVPFVGACVGGVVVAMATGGSLATAGARWFLGEALGAVLVVPLLASVDRASLRAFADGRRRLEAAALVVFALAALAWTVERLAQPSFLLILPILWAAFRLGPSCVAVVGAFVVGAMVVATDVVGLPAFGPIVVPGVVLAPWAAFGLLLPYAVSLLLTEQRHEHAEVVERERYFREAMHHSPFGMAILGLDGYCIAANRALGDMLGYTPEELVGLHATAIAFPEDKPDVGRRVGSVIRGEVAEYATERRYRRKDGGSIWVLVAVSVVRDETGAPLHLITQMKDIDERKRAEKALEESESRWNFALESAGQGVWDYDYRRRDTFYSPMWSRMLGYEPGELSGESDAWLALVHPYDLPRLLRHEHQHLQGETEQFECEFRMRHKDGRWLWILDRGKVIVRDVDGRPLRMIGTHTDITEHRRLTEALQEEKERLRITLHSIGDGVICTDAEGRITFMNPIAEALTGRLAADALGAPAEKVFAVVREGADAPAVDAVGACLAGLERVTHGDGLVLIGRDGVRMDVEASVSPVRKTSGELIGTVLVFQDVTRARTLQKELAELATHDALTGLQNRTAFEVALEAHCASAVAEGGGHALCFLDLDRFKIINDTAGHAAGDALLREVGRLVREQMRRHDLVARLGGDEFGILLTDCEVDAAERIAERLIERIGRVRFSWDGRVYEVGASIGIARVDAETPLAADVMSRADVACYAAKAAGRNRVSVYHPSEGDARRHHAELHTAAGIRAALDTDRFVVFAQEIRDLRPSGHLHRHAELLVRMREDDGSLKPPGAFIPAAERYGLMAAIDRWMIHRVLSVYGRDILAVPRLSVSVNLSANSLEDRSLLGFLAEELEGSVLPPHRLRFEITETSLINNITQAGRLVEDLRAAGCAIMLDDFGAGVSSFAYLEQFPADFIKIDGGFVRKMTTNAVDRAIVESINDIGHKIGAVTVAEFVEDAETLATLAEIGVDMAQGWHIARPEPIEDLLSRLGAEDFRRATM